MKIIIYLTKTFLQGIVVGIANIIPGVSGGTMALVMGIYERFISALHNISFATIKSFLNLFRFSKGSFNEFKTEMERIDAKFLCLIGFGAISAIAALAKIMTLLLSTYHDPTYGFFFGLVLTSAFVPYKMIKKKSAPVFISMIIAIFCISALSFSMSPEEKMHKAKVKCELEMNQNKTSKISTTKSPGFSADTAQGIMIFIAGFIAISAMILPGISGSFLLLLMGQYFTLLKAVNDRNLFLIGCFMLGAIFGLLIFTRFLNWLLKNYHDKTIGFLLGLVIGSLWAIWPFKEYSMICNEKIYLENTMPGSFNINATGTILTFTAGCIIVFAMIILEKKYSKNN